MTTHAHYHEITADTPYEMGVALGRAFGAALRPFLEGLADVPEPVNEYLSACLALTRHRFPDYAAELEGYASGAGTSVNVLWQMLLEDDINALMPEKCTSFVTNNARLIGHNEDWDAAAAGRLFILRRVLAGRTMLELHYAGTLGGNAISITSAGTVQMINSLESLPLDMSAPRVPTNIIARFLADSADTDAAMAALQKIPRMGGYAHTLVEAKAGGKHRLIELSQHDMAAQSIGSFPFAHANHYVLEEMLQFNQRPPASSESSRCRHAAAFEGARAQMQPKEAMSLLESDGAGPDNSLMNSRTIAGVVLDLDARAAWIRLASEPDKSWLKYPLDFLP